MLPQQLKREIFYFPMYASFVILAHCESHGRMFQSIPAQLCVLYWCIIFTIDFGTETKPSMPFTFFSKKCPKLNLDTPIITKILLLPLLSASHIYILCFILEKRMFLEEKVKGIGVSFRSENRYLK